MADTSDVTVENTGETYICQADTPLLDAALAAGIHMPHNCRGGACGTCKAKLVEGSVDHGWVMSFAITDEEKDEGYCLCCQAKPLSPTIRLRMTHDMHARTAGETLIVPAEVTTQIVAAHPVTPSVLRLVIALPTHTQFRFRAGMNMEFELPGIEPARPYSITDVPTVDGMSPDGDLTFYITRHPHGLSSGWLHEKARIGDSLVVRGPYGEFGIPAGHGGPILALAGGTGLSPILSVLGRALADGLSEPVRLLFSVREERELFACDDLARLARRHDNFTWQATLTREAAHGTWATGRIPAVLQREAATLDGHAVLIAGSPSFVDACSAAAQAQGANAACIVIDSFLSRTGTGAL